MSLVVDVSAAIQREACELAWAAAIYETRGHRASRFLEVRVTDSRLAERFAAAVSAGKVFGPYGPYEIDGWYAGTRAPFCLWREFDPETIRLVLQRLGPYLTV